MSPLACEDVEKLLFFYLDHEVAPGERRLIEQHLAGCAACQQKLAALAATRKSAAQALQGLAAQAGPAPQAWERLQSRLAAEPASRRSPWPAKEQAQSARTAPRAGRAPWNTLQGAFQMRTKIVLPAVVALIVLAALGFFLAQNVTPVSAQQVLERAAQARTSAAAAQGIRHLRMETYLNLQATGQKSGAAKTISDSYVDRATGIFRQVTRDGDTGQVLNASAYDGSYWITRNEAGGQGNNPLTLYRAPQSLAKMAKLMPDGDTSDQEKSFYVFSQEARTQQVSKETWSDGRAVYVLRTKLPEGAAQKYRISHLEGESITVFDAQTYDLLEDRIVMLQDGKEVVLPSYRKLVNEILPAGSPVAWDLSDVPGIQIVDDPNAEHVDLLPELITPQQLAARTQTGYLLKTVPAGFSLELSAPPQQANEAVYIYIAAYRDAQNRYFLLMSGKGTQDLSGQSSDVYKTASGLALYFLPERNQDAGESLGSTVVVVTPEQAEFILSSNLPRQQVQALAEDLALVR